MNDYYTQSFYHAIRPDNYLSSLEKLELILKYNYIYTKESLNKYNIPHNDYPQNQGNNAISICWHPNNKLNTILYDIFYSQNLTNLREDTAYNMFVNDNIPSIILSPSIITELNVRLTKDHYRMTDEIQVEQDIPLTYMTAINYKYPFIIKTLLQKYNYNVPIINIKKKTKSL